MAENSPVFDTLNLPTNHHGYPDDAPTNELPAIARIEVPQLERNLIIAALSRRSVQGAVADEVAQAARERCAVVAEAWGAQQAEIKAAKGWRAKLQASQGVGTQLCYVVSEAVLGGTRNFKVAAEARSVMRAENNPYTMELRREGETGASDWAEASAAIAQRMALASASLRQGSPKEVLPGEKVQLIEAERESRVQGELTARYRHTLEVTLANLLIDESKGNAGAAFQDEQACAQRLRLALQSQFSPAEFAQLFGPDASNIIVADSLFLAKRQLSHYIAKTNITEASAIAEVVQKSLATSVVGTATAHAGAIGQTPGTLESFYDRWGWPHEKAGRASAIIAPRLGVAAVKTVVAAAATVMVGVQGLGLAVVAGAAAGPVVVAAHSVQRARQELSQQRRQVEQGRGEEENSDLGLQRAYQAAELMDQAAAILNAPKVTRENMLEAFRLQHTIAWAHQHPAGMVRYEKGHIDAQRTQLIGMVTVLEDYITKNAPAITDVQLGMSGQQDWAMQDLQQRSYLLGEERWQFYAKAICESPRRYVWALLLGGTVGALSTAAHSLVSGHTTTMALEATPPAQVAATPTTTAPLWPQRTVQSPSPALLHEARATLRVEARVSSEHTVSPAHFLARHEEDLHTVQITGRHWSQSSSLPVYASTVDTQGDVHIAARGLSLHADAPAKLIVTFHHGEQSVVLPLGADGRIVIEHGHPLAQIMAQRQYASAEIAVLRHGHAEVLATDVGQSSPVVTDAAVPLSKDMHSMVSLPHVRSAAASQPLLPDASSPFDHLAPQPRPSYSVTPWAMASSGIIGAGVVAEKFRRRQVLIREARPWVSWLRTLLVEKSSLHPETPLHEVLGDVEVLNIWFAKARYRMYHDNFTNPQSQKRIYDQFLHLLGLRDLVDDKGRITTAAFREACAHLEHGLGLPAWSKFAMIKQA